MQLVLYLLGGLVAGLLAGLFGVGGGIVIVPLLIYVFTAQGVPTEVLTHLAVGTSLATILFTSLSSVRAHQKAGAVIWPIFRWLTLGILLGSGLGALTASYIPGQELQCILGGFAILMAIQMALDLRPKTQRPVPGPQGLSVAGMVIGWASAIFGVGGGSLTVPFLVWRSLPIQKAVGTSAACGFPIALTSACAFVVLGWHNPQLPAWSAGYVYLPAVAGIALGSLCTAPLGARLAHRLPARTLKRLFAVLLVGVGINLMT